MPDKGGSSETNDKADPKDGSQFTEDRQDPEKPQPKEKDSSKRPEDYSEYT